MPKPPEVETTLRGVAPHLTMATPGEINTYGDPDGGISAPTGVIVAPDGDVWFTSIGNHRVGRVRPSSGTVETFVDPADRLRLPANIIPAADGRLWFTCLGAGMLASIDPAAPDPATTVAHHPHPDLDGPVAIKSAPDGRLWFTLRGGEGAIGTLDPRADDPLATLAIHRSPTIDGPSALFADEHGLIWWVNAGSGTIGRLQPGQGHDEETPRIVAFRIQAGSPRAWAVDRDGLLWLTLREPTGLLSFDPVIEDPLASARHVSHPELMSPDGIWLGGDGALWIADADADHIVRYDPAVRMPGEPWSFFGGPPEVDGPFDIKGDGGALLWFTNKNGNTLASIDTGR